MNSSQFQGYKILAAEGKALLFFFFFPLMKKEKFSTNEQCSWNLLTISEFPLNFLSRILDTALASCSIPEGRVMKRQKIGTFDFTACRHKK